MKLNVAQLDSHLASSLASVYLVAGDDPIQKQDIIQQIRKAAQRRDFKERIRLNNEAGLEEEQLYTALYSPSLSGDKTIIECDFRGKVPAKNVTGILESYLEKPAKDLLVVINADKLEDSALRSGWYKSTEKNGVIVTIWPITRDQLPQWIITRAKKYKMAMQTDAANLLADYVEGNLTAAAQAIEKIYLLKPEKTIDAELVQTILTDESSYTVFDLTEAMLGTDSARMRHILETLRLDGTEAAIVLWSITRELRALAEISAGQQAGANTDELFKKHRIFPRRQAITKRFLTRFNPKKYQTCLRQAANIDAMIKGGLGGNCWEALELLMVGMI